MLGVVSNTHSIAVLAADACGDVGLQVAGLAADTQRALRDMLGRRGPGGRAGRYHRAGRPRPLPPVPGAGRRRPGRGRGAGADDHDRGQRSGSRGGRRAVAGAASPRPCWIRSKWSGCCQARAGTPLRSRPMPTPSPPSAPWATPRATAPGGRPRRDGCRTWRACARTGPGNWSPTFSPARPGRLAGPGPHRGTARLLRRAASQQRRGHHRGRRRPRRRPGSAAPSRSGRTCPACRAPATPATC